MARDVPTSWRQLFCEFTRETTFHGMRFITGETGFSCRRFLWCLLVLASICTFTTYTFIRTLTYFNYDSITGVDIVYEDQMPFPAVTICNQNMFRAHKAGEANMYGPLSRLYEGRTLSNRSGPNATCQADILFLIDDSSSMHNFVNFPFIIKKFIKQFINEIKIGPEAYQIAVMSFNQEATLHVSLGKQQNKTGLFDAINKIKLVGGKKCVGLGLNAAREQVFRSERQNREDIPDVIILITDASENDPHTWKGAKSCRDEGIVILSIGIGPYPIRDKLLEISMEEGFVFGTDDLDLELLQTEVQQNIIKDGCVDPDLQWMSSQSSEKFLLDAAHTGEGLIIDCVWRGVPCHWSDFVEKLSDAGVCYTFFGPRENNTHSLFWKLYTNTSGVSGGLSLLLNTETYEYIDGQTGGTGLQVLLHDRQELPLMRGYAGYALPGTSIYIATQLTKEKLLPSPWGKCGSVPIEVWGEYSKEKCEYNQLLHQMIKTCHCIGPEYNVTMANLAFPVVNGSHSYCNMEKYVRCAKEVFHNGVAQSARSSCPLQCNKNNYQWSASFTSLSASMVNMTFRKKNLTETLRKDYFRSLRQGARLNRYIHVHDFTILSELQLQCEVLLKTLKYSETTIHFNQTYMQYVRENDWRLMKVFLDDINTDLLLTNKVQTNIIVAVMKEALRCVEGILLTWNRQPQDKGTHSCLASSKSNLEHLSTVPIHQIIPVEELSSLLSVERDSTLPEQTVTHLENKTTSCPSKRPFAEQDVVKLFQASTNHMQEIIDFMDEVEYNFTTGQYSVDKNSKVFLITHYTKLIEIELELQKALLWYEVHMQGHRNTLTEKLLELERRMEHFQSADQAQNSTLFGKFRDELIKLDKSVSVTVQQYKANEISKAKAAQYFERFYGDFDDITRLFSQSQITTTTWGWSAKRLYKTLARADMYQFFLECTLGIKGFYNSTGDLLGQLSIVQRVNTMKNDTCVSAADHIRNAYGDDRTLRAIRTLIECETSFWTSHSKHMEERDFEQKLRNQFFKFRDLFTEIRSDFRAYINSMKISDTFIKKNFIKLHVYFKELSYRVITQKQTFAGLSLVAEIGGYMGMLLGASLLSVCEFLDLVVIKGFLKLRTAGNRTPRTNKQNNTTQDPLTMKHDSLLSDPAYKNEYPTRTAQDSFSKRHESLLADTFYKRNEYPMRTLGNKESTDA